MRVAVLLLLFIQIGLVAFALVYSSIKTPQTTLSIGTSNSGVCGTCVNGTNGAIGPQGPAGRDGINGTDGSPGINGTDGFHCWDTNMDHICGEEEDLNNDGECTVSDCILVVNSLCENVTCNSGPCEIQVCVEGQCVVTGYLDFCCTASEQCDDGNPCTSDQCINHKCVHGIQGCSSDVQCPDDFICLNCTCQMQTSELSCDDSADCDDGIICTIDICERKGFCKNIPLPGCCTQNSDCRNDTAICSLGYSCNTLNGLCIPNSYDGDGDGVECILDCDDTDPLIGAPVNIYRDEDEDGFGSSTDSLITCQPSNYTGYVGSSGDCDDQDLCIGPNATKRCNGLDNNCDGIIDTSQDAVDCLDVPYGQTTAGNGFWINQRFAMDDANTRMIFYSQGALDFTLSTTLSLFFEVIDLSDGSFGSLKLSTSGTYQPISSSNLYRYGLRVDPTNNPSEFSVVRLRMQDGNSVLSYGVLSASDVLNPSFTVPLTNFISAPSVGGAFISHLCTARYGSTLVVGYLIEQPSLGLRLCELTNATTGTFSCVSFGDTGISYKALEAYVKDGVIYFAAITQGNVIQIWKAEKSGTWNFTGTTIVTLANYVSAVKDIAIGEMVDGRMVLVWTFLFDSAGYLGVGFGDPADRFSWTLQNLGAVTDQIPTQDQYVFLEYALVDGKMPTFVATVSQNFASTEKAQIFYYSNCDSLMRGSWDKRTISSDASPFSDAGFIGVFPGVQIPDTSLPRGSVKRSLVPLSSGKATVGYIDSTGTFAGNKNVQLLQ